MLKYTEEVDVNTFRNQKEDFKAMDKLSLFNKFNLMKTKRMK